MTDQLNKTLRRCGFDYCLQPASAEHIPHLAANLRPADRRELWAASRQKPAEALAESLERSPLAWTVLVEGRPVLMWGAARSGSLMWPLGVPWLLSTGEIYRISREFIRRSREFVDRMAELFPRMENYVHRQNRLSLRWLEWCGFTVDRETPHVMRGEIFYRFYLNRKQER